MPVRHIKIVGLGDSGYIHEMELGEYEVEAIEQDSGLFHVKMLRMREMEEQRSEK